MDFSQQGLMGALAQLAQAQQQGTQRADAAYGALAGHLQEPMDRSGALMRMAQGFMSPTRTGGFAESAGLAIGGFADARDRMQDMDLARRKKLTEIEAARARLGMEGAQNRFNIFQTGHGLQQQAEADQALGSFNSWLESASAAPEWNVGEVARRAQAGETVLPGGGGILGTSGFDAPVIRPGADIPAAGASPAGDLIPPVNEGSFFIPPGDTGQSRRIRQSEADMFGMPEGMDQRPAPGYSPFDDAGMMGTLPDRGAADRPARGAGQREADMRAQARGDGFRVANDEVGDLGSLMSPDMAMMPEQGRRFEAQPQPRQAGQPTAAPQRDTRRPAPAPVRDIIQRPSRDLPSPGTDEADMMLDQLNEARRQEQERIDQINRQFGNVAGIADDRTQARVDQALSEINRRKAQIDARIAELTPETLGATEARQIMTDFNRETAPHAEVFRRFGEMRAFLENPSGTSDTQAFNILQRMFDPGMRRPGGEQDEVMGTSQLDRAANAFALWKDGELATDGLRRELMFAAQTYLDGYLSDIDNLKDGYSDFVTTQFPRANPESLFGARTRQAETVRQILNETLDGQDPPTLDRGNRGGGVLDWFQGIFGVSQNEAENLSVEQIQEEIRRRQEGR